jgi:hypothetical protein
MKPLRWTAGLLLAVAAVVSAAAKPDAKDDNGFVPLFNGKDLTGWVNVNCAPSTFYVKDGEIITTGKPTGYLRTAKQYENFIADFEWMHVNKKEVGNSGFFVWADPIPAVGTPYTRGIEVQVLVNLETQNATSHGDLFSIWGATCVPDRPHPHGWARCLPSERRCKGGGEWNHYKVVANNGTIKLHVNGKEVSGVSQCKPRKGYLALESEGAECHFRNLKIKELPSTDPRPDEVAEVAKGFVSLYTGLDLSGWKADDAAREQWQPHDSVLHKGLGKDSTLTSEKEFMDAEFVADFRFPEKAARRCAFTIRAGDMLALGLEIAPDKSFAVKTPDARIMGNKLLELKPVGQWNRLHMTLKRAAKGTAVEVLVNGANALEDLKAASFDLPGKRTVALGAEGEMDFTNLFLRQLP